MSGKPRSSNATRRVEGVRFPRREEKEAPRSVASDSLLGAWQLAGQRTLDLGDDGVVGDRLTRLVLVDDGWLHVQVLRNQGRRSEVGCSRIESGGGAIYLRQLFLRTKNEKGRRERTSAQARGVVPE